MRYRRMLFVPLVTSIVSVMMSQHQQQGMAQHQQPGMMQHQQPGMQYMMNPSVYSMNPQQQQQMMMSNQLILNKLQQQNTSQFGSQQETRAEPNKQQFNNIQPQQQGFSGQQGFGGQPFGGSVQGIICYTVRHTPYCIHFSIPISIYVCIYMKDFKILKKLSYYNEYKSYLRNHDCVTVRY